MKKSGMVLFFFCLAVLFQQANPITDTKADNIKGVQFEKSGLDETLAKAQTANKLVLLDFYTDT